MLRVLAFICALFAVVNLCAPPVSAQVVRDGATNVIVYNGYTQDVVVMLTVPGVPTNGLQSDGCPTGTIASIRYINLTTAGQPTALTAFSKQTQGWFILKAGQKAQILNVGINPVTRQVSSCFQGVLLGFNQIGNQCADRFNATTTTPPLCGTAPTFYVPTQFPNTVPGPTFNQAKSPPNCLPNGSNAFEFTLNMPGTINGQTTYNGTPAPSQESIDISCVNGANCKLTVQITPPAAGPYWQTNLGPALGGVKFFRTFTQFGPNSWVNVNGKKDDNCVDPATGYARPGIFPYGCTICNVYPDGKAPCGAPSSPFGQFCAAKNGLPANNGCGYARSPLVAGIQRFGGTVQVTYLGPISPP